jgi:tetratricopeptide (TPR) repeat protein
VQNADEKSSSNLTKNKTIGFKNKRVFDFNDFRWMLSAMAMVASFYNCLGYQKHCEQVYVRYVTLVEDFYEKDSVEAGNAYFMIGVYYFEQEQLQKSLACFIKTLYIRKVKLGQNSLGCADCHYNMAILYKKLGIPAKTLEHYKAALEIRKE